ncbi:MAG: hypothetical protein IJU90_07695 [Bacteroidales bacterium]|nr:hypothetical protein [Bacteroidales bacterium]
MSTKQKKESFFWTSYSDLMTSMFFVMLVLFVLAIALLHHKVVEIQSLYDEVKVKNEQYEKILQLETQFEELGRSSDFMYVEDKRMFVAKDFVGIEIFNPNEATIKQEHIATVDKVGKSLQDIVKRLFEKNPDLMFQLVIEGNAAIPWEKKHDGTYNPDNNEMYKLSYERALALYMYWKQNGIDLRNYNTEVIISGSGFNGINRDTVNEDNNKRFIIQIIPKPSNFSKIE